MYLIDVPTDFTPVVQTEIPNSIIIKHAKSGYPISEWISGNEYDAMMDKVFSAIQGKQISSVVFVWMQGESDASASKAPIYADRLRTLIDRITGDLGLQVDVVIGRLGAYLKGDTYWDMVRDAQVQVANKYNGIWIDTDDLGTDLHFSGYYAILAKRFAEAAINLAGVENR